MRRDRPFHATLRDGTRTLVRPIEPDDRYRIAEGMHLLSPRSRYLRFHSAVSELTEAQLDYLTQVDGVDHVAWIALDEDNPDVPGIGVARYVRLAEDPTIAEAAVTVLDAYQGRGAGTILLATLARSARRNGVAVFRNYVLSDNAAMLELFETLGASRELEAPGLYRVDLELPERDQELSATALGRAFLEVARKGWAIASTIPPLWMRPGERDEGGVTLEGLDDELDAWLADRETRR
jgi:GNAT superfamily N-acetyltransferase